MTTILRLNAITSNKKASLEARFFNDQVVIHVRAMA